MSTSSFSIDDVRESFAADMGAFLDQVEAGSQAALATPLLTAGADAEAIERLTDSYHAIAGTCALVAADGLSRAAALLEKLAGRAREDVAALAARAARARWIVDLCAKSAGTLREMLGHELDARAEASLALCETLEKAATGEPGLADAEPAAPEGWSFGDPEQAAPSHEPGPASPELRAIFREEATRMLGGLGPLLETVALRPDDSVAATQLERMFHTLKGAAATVGFAEVARLAAGIQDELEAVVDASGVVSPALLASATRAAWTIAAAADITGVALPAPLSGEPPVAFDFTDVAPAARREPASTVELTLRPAPVAVKGAFNVELEQTREEILALVARLDGDRREQAQSELAAIFHRLKGSALIAGHADIAADAERLQARCENASDGAGLAAEITAAVSRPRAQASQPPLVRDAVKSVEPSLLEAFNQECGEIFDSVERLILDLDRVAEPRQVIEALLRPYHTLKGAVNSIGLTPVGKELHRLEDFLELLSEGEVMPPPRALAAFLIEVQSGLRRNLRLAKQGYVETSLPRLEQRIETLRGRPTHGSSQAGQTGSMIPSHLSDDRASRHSIDSRASGPAGEGSNELFDSAHMAERRTLRVATERLDALMNLAGELVVSRSRLLSRVDAVRSLHRDLGRSRRRLVETIEHFRERHEFTLGVKAKEPAPATAAAPDAGNAGFTEFELDRYDDVNVLARSLAEISNDIAEMDSQVLVDLGAFSDDSEALAGLVTGIQAEVTSARMVPLETLFTRLRLAVRDVADREHKDVRVVTQGEAVRLDKTIIDALFTPLLHLTRNAVGHGIETPSARVAAGKLSEGTVSLSGRQESGQIVIEVSDDGAGLDLAGLYRQGIAAGLIGPDVSVSDEAVKNLVFAPGLSTREVAGDVAGRGIGGEVVRRTVQRLNGDVRVATRAGSGTSFTITLPISLAITRAVVVKHGEQTYAVPLYFAERVLAADETHVLDSAGVRRLEVDGVYHRLDRLEECFGATRAGNDGPVLLLRVGDERSALQVDSVIGQEEIVVKRLGDLLGGHPVFSGMTVRGAGDLVLILDVPGLMRQRGGGREIAPAAPQQLYPVPAARQAAPAAAAAPAARTRALWVDDSLSVRKVAEKELLGLDVDVVTAVDGLDALAKLREGRFDIVFADLEMPNMNGYELLREVRANPQYRALPVIVVSSRSGAKHLQRASEHGASAFVTKPFSAETLGRLLDEWVPTWRGRKS